MQTLDHPTCQTKYNFYENNVSTCGPNKKDKKNTFSESEKHRSTEIKTLKEIGRGYFEKFKHRITGHNDNGNQLLNRAINEQTYINELMCTLAVNTEFKLESYYFNVTSDPSLIFMFEFENEYSVYAECFISEDIDELNETVVFVNDGDKDIFWAKDQFGNIYKKLVDIFKVK